MFMFLLALFVAVPLLELWVIIEVGSRIGVVYTIIALVLISVTGAALARQQGYRVVAGIQSEIQSGKMPSDSLLDGALILAGALMLLTPGFITDFAGLLLLFPLTRIPFRSFARRRLKKAVERRSVFVWMPGGRGGPGDGPQDSGFSGRPGGGDGRNGEAPYEPEQRRRELED